MWQNYIGERFGAYKLVRLLGEGGFGTVYLGEKVHDGTSAAVKLLKEQKVHDFINEVRYTILLPHTNIIPIRDFGIRESDDIAYIIMEYAPNSSFRKKYPRGTRIPLDVVVPTVKQVASALQYAHDNRVIHRDVKPENLLLNAQNMVLLSDFGIATASRTTMRANVKDAEKYEVWGDFPYMAPEQLRGHPVPASDQYSLAIMVYEWLCGELPFQAPQNIPQQQQYILWLYLHESVPPPSLCERNPAISPAIEQVVLKALTKKPEDRFRSVQDFAYALEQAIQPPSAIPLPPHIALALRECYYQYPGVDWGELREITEEDARPYTSRRGTKGYRYLFTKGAIYWSERGKAQPIWGGFADIHRAWEKEDGDYLGFPLTSELPAAKSPQRTEGVYQRFEGPWDDYPEKKENTNSVRYGASLYYSRHGAYLTWGSIGLHYERLYGTAGKLGFPTTGEEAVESQEHQTKGMYQCFEGGCIYWLEGATKAYPTWGAIGQRYHTLKRTAGRLGFPLSSEIDVLSAEDNKLLGRYQHFQGGTIYWKKSPQNETFPVWGGIGNFYEEIGGAKSPLGFPISAEKEARTNKEWYQHFEHGDIYLQQDKLAVVVKEAILAVYKQFDGINGKFGFPQASETTSAEHPELIMQEFEGGMICVKVSS